MSIFSKLFGRSQPKTQVDILKQPRAEKRPAQPKPSDLVAPYSPRFALGLAGPSPMDLASQLRSYASWPYACIKMKADEMANIKLRLCEKDKNGQIKIIEHHEVLDLLDLVNDFTTRYDLFELTAIFWELTGEAFWWKIRDNNGKIVSIYPYLSPVFMNVVVDPERFIGGYVYNVPGSGKQVPFDADDIIHFKYQNPLNMYRGMSPIKAAEFAVASDKEASKWNWRFFRNEARPSGVIKIPGTLSQDQYDRMLMQWEASHKGESNSHKVAIIEGGGEFAEIGFSQKDMDFLKQREFSRDEIFAIFGVPKGIILADDVNRATAEAHRVAFIENTIIPMMRKLVSYLTEFLLPEYAGTENMYFDFENPLPKNTEIDLVYYQNGIQNGWLSANEVRGMEGFKPFEGGDALRLPFTFGEIGATDSNGSKIFKSNVKRLKMNTTEKIETAVREKLDGLDDKQKMALISKIQKRQDAKAKKKTAKGLKFTEEIKMKVWNNFVKKLDAEESSMKKMLVKQFARQERLVMESVHEKSFEENKKALDFRFNTEREARIFIDIFTPLLMNFIKDHGEDALNLLGLEDFDMASPNVREFLKTQGLKFAKEVNDVTADKLAKTIAEGNSAGEGITQIKDRISSVFKEAEDSRAFAIARTETSRASNFGIIEGYKQSGVVKGKEWVTAFDERTCEYCASMNGKIVSLDDNYFERGDEFKPRGADAPMDFGYSDVGEPPLHVNCRCVTIPVVVD
jgi:HK97 family phage portal protein